MDLKALADKYIPDSDGKTVLKKEGDTNDIIAVVLSAANKSREQLRQFAPHLKADTLQQTLFNIWKFWKYNITYKKDEGGQYIQQPKALWESKVGDCKSLSVAVLNTLYALDIKAALRFTSYGDNKERPTHVYVVVKHKGKEIPVDCVWKEFGTQKPFTKKWDYNMTKIFEVSGLEDTATAAVPEKLTIEQLKAMPLQQRIAYIKARRKKSKPGLKDIFHIKPVGKTKIPRRGILKIGNNPNITPEIMDKLLLKQRLEMEQKIHTRAKGLGDEIDKGYELHITGLHNALAPAMGWERIHTIADIGSIPPDARFDAALNGIGDLPNERDAEILEAVEGIHGFFDFIKGAVKAVGKAAGAVGKAIGKGAAAAGKGVFKGVKTVVKTAGKVVTAPVKLIGKGVKWVGKQVGKVLSAPQRQAITETLPQVAPFFLYLYITDPRILNKLPERVKLKRDKAIYYQKLITGKLGMSDSNFTSTVRNGIMNAFGNSPENVIAQWIRDTNFQIGFLESIISSATGLLSKVMGDLGQNLEADAQNYMPQVEDWGTVNPAAAANYSSDIQQQQTNSLMYPQTDSSLYNTYVPQYRAAQQQYSNYGYGGGFDPGYQDAAQTDQPFYGNDGSLYPATGNTFGKTQTLDEVVVDPAASENKSNNGLMIAGGLALGLLLLAKKKR